MVDGITAVDIGEVILEETPEVRTAPATTWRPAAPPTTVELLAGAMADSVAHPRTIVDRVSGGLGTAREALGHVASAVMDAVRSPDEMPLIAEVGQQRRFSTLDISLDDMKSVRRARGGTINDVALAIIAGGLRSWLLARGESVSGGTVVRTLVPMGVKAEDDRESASLVDAFLVDLPVGEPDPVIRLQRIVFDTARFGETGRAVGAKAMVDLVGFAPPTLHTLGARVGASLSQRSYSLSVTNVPGPQTALYAGGARMLAAYPIVPLTERHALSIGLTSYDGGVFFGLNADRDAMPDLDVLVQCLRDSLAELTDSTSPGGGSRLRAVKPVAGSGAS